MNLKIYLSVSKQKKNGRRNRTISIFHLSRPVSLNRSSCVICQMDCNKIHAQWNTQYYVDFYLLTNFTAQQNSNMNLLADLAIHFFQQNSRRMPNLTNVVAINRLEH